MAVVAFPETRRVSIPDPAEHEAVEALVSAISGLAVAMGGTAALAGRELFALPVPLRARMLTEMYDDGEVVFGWREPSRGEVFNVALEKIAVRRGDAEALAWRASLYAEEAEGHVLRGAAVEPTLDETARRLTAAASGAPAALHPTTQAALAAYATRCG